MLDKQLFRKILIVTYQKFFTIYFIYKYFLIRNEDLKIPYVHNSNGDLNNYIMGSLYNKDIPHYERGEYLFGGPKNCELK